MTVGLMLVASSSNATETESVAKELAGELVDSFVKNKLLTACGTHISNTGKQVVTIDTDCISTVNELLQALETEPNANELVSKVSAFMEANNIPKTH